MHNPQYILVGQEDLIYIKYIPAEGVDKFSGDAHYMKIRKMER